jgi:hypothetical protein
MAFVAPQVLRPFDEARAMQDLTASLANSGERTRQGASQVLTIISGSDHGQWRPLADALASVISSRLGNLAATVSTTIDGSDSASRWILLIERPEIMLARWQETGPPGQLGRALDDWCASATAALALRKARGKDTLLLPADTASSEATCIGPALVDWDPELQGLHLPLLKPNPPDAQWLDIAQRVCAAHSRSRRLYEALVDQGAGLLPPSERMPVKAHDVGPAAHIADRDMAILSESHFPVQPDLDGQADLIERFHEVQRELEETYLQLQRARAGQGRHDAADGAIRAGHARIVQLDDSSERMLVVELRQLEVRGRLLTRVRVGVVLEDGLPGLRVWAACSEPEIISAWQPDGQHGGLDYVQFVPGRAEDRHRLQFLGAADWRVVVGIASLLRVEIEARRAAIPQRWHIVAAQLCRQLEELPARFRYDAIEVALLDGSSGESGLNVSFVNSSFGALPLATVRLQWSPTGLRWLLDPEVDGLPLASWPMSADGAPTAQLQLPVGSAVVDSKSRRWQQLTDQDCNLVLALLDALPAFGAMAHQLGVDFGGQARLRRSARSFAREAHRAVFGIRLRRRLAMLPGVRRLATPVSSP